MACSSSNARMRSVVSAGVTRVEDLRSISRASDHPSLPRTRAVVATSVSWVMSPMSMGAPYRSVKRTVTNDVDGEPPRQPRTGNDEMKPYVTLITLGVDDLERAVAFYRDGLGFPTKGIVGREFEHGAVAFFELQS